MKAGLQVIRYLAFFWILVLSAGTFLQYYDFSNRSEFLDIKQSAVATGWYLPAFYSHIIGSSIVLLAGFFQFNKRVYSRKKLHRLLGRIYVLGVLLFSAPGAYLMTIFIDRGPWVALSFFVQNTLWVLFTALGWRYILNGEAEGHVRMMRRSYALAFAAVTLRLYIWLLTVLGNGVSFEHNYVVIAFLSWVPNLLVVEWWNTRQGVRVGVDG